MSAILFLTAPLTKQDGPQGCCGTPVEKGCVNELAFYHSVKLNLMSTSAVPISNQEIII